MHPYKNLLDQVSAITTRYKKIAELTGENFNVFRILKLESSEVRMHSAFIAELLNPNGSHGQKDIFLKLFADKFCYKNNTIDTASCRVKIEDYIGLINEDKTEGGRIDIIVRDKNDNHIIIENKIYAIDQKQQLTRYFNYSQNADIIYLTLDGKPPSDDSKGLMEEGVNFKRYSYKHDLLNWLELCRKEVSVYPIVREAITHYINLVKHLTHQTLNKNMQEELSNLLKSNIEAAWAISENLDTACQKVSDDFGESIKREFEKLGLNCKYYIDFEEQYSGIWITKPEWKHVKISFQFQRYDKDMIYGISTQKDPAEASIPIELKEKLGMLPNNTCKNTGWWLWYRNLEYPYNNWDKLEAWRAIFDGRMKDVLIEKMQYLLKLTKDIEM